MQGNKRFLPDEENGDLIEPDEKPLPPQRIDSLPQNPVAEELFRRLIEGPAILCILFLFDWITFNNDCVNNDLMSVCKYAFLLETERQFEIRTPINERPLPETPSSDDVSDSSDSSDDDSISDALEDDDDEESVTTETKDLPTNGSALNHNHHTSPVVESNNCSSKYVQQPT